MCVQFEVSITNVLLFIGLYVEKRGKKATSIG